MGTAVNFINIPAELKSNCRFCVWKMEKGTGKSTRLTKVPYNPATGSKAQTDHPETFAPFATAMKTYAMGGFDGIGIRVSSGIGAIDIDHCIREDGSLNDVAASILGIFKDAYFERSPSGTGLRGFFRVDPDFSYDKTVYYINNRKHGLEVYLPGATNRFVTVTGNQYRTGSVPLDMAALQTILDSFMKRATPVVNTHIEACSYLTDEEVIKKATKAKDGYVFRDYMAGNWHEHFDNQSDADMSFVSKLAFWCGCVEEQMDRIFRSSGMMRPKWDEYRGESTYGSITLRNAVASCKEIYMPKEMQDAEDAAREFENLDNVDDSDTEERMPDYSIITVKLEEMAPHSNPHYGQGEIGIGYMFADYFKQIARYNEDRGVWFYYDGAIWRPDPKDGKTSNPEMLAAKFGNSNSSGPSEEVARLNGARFVNISEPEKKLAFNAALVKRMTGNNMLNARMLHENSFDFKPKFKIFIDTNYRPNISDMTLFESNRIKMIPFNRHFEESEQDKTLKGFFSQPDNLSAIFNWCLDGYHIFQRKHLEKPQAVIDAIADYRKESDRIAQFIEAWLEVGEAYEVRTSAAYKLYQKWCDDNGYRADNKKGFNTAMQVHFTRKDKRPAEGGNPTTMFLGCRIRIDDEEDGSEVLKKEPDEFDIVR